MSSAGRAGTCCSSATSPTATSRIRPPPSRCCTRRLRGRHQLRPDAPPRSPRSPSITPSTAAGSPYYLASALYAWAYLFPDDPKAAPDRFDPRVASACDLYNRGLTQGSEAGRPSRPGGGTYALPFGTLEVSVDPAHAPVERPSAHRLLPVAELVVEGLPHVLSLAGIGAPLAARVKPDRSATPDILARRARVPVTAVLRPRTSRELSREAPCTARLELIPATATQTVKVGGADVPLEAEPTATIALTLAETPVWDARTAGFLRARRRSRSERGSSRRARTSPGSSRWSSSTARARASGAGRSSTTSSTTTRASTRATSSGSSRTRPATRSSTPRRCCATRSSTPSRSLDPEGTDPALRRMVVIGHSQGGLLTKTMVVDSGDALLGEREQRSRSTSSTLERRDARAPAARRLLPPAAVRAARRVRRDAAPWQLRRGELARTPGRAPRQRPLRSRGSSTDFATLNSDALAVRGLRARRRRSTT